LQAPETFLKKGRRGLKENTAVFTFCFIEKHLIFFCLSGLRFYEQQEKNFEVDL
jgi:hypothetical protein